MTRLNKFIASSLGISRRGADNLIADGKVTVNDKVATVGMIVGNNDQVVIGHKQVLAKNSCLSLMLNKPAGYVCSRKGQGNQTVYNLLPINYQRLKLAGRLDKESSGLIILSDDGQLIYQLSHPSSLKTKRYMVLLDRPLEKGDLKAVKFGGVTLKDGLSKFKIKQLKDNTLDVQMNEGRNRQIRRTFEALGYKVIKLHRLEIGDYKLNDLPEGQYKLIN